MRALPLLLLLAACGPDPGEFTNAKLIQAIQTNPARIDLGEYVTGEWDRACFFQAGTPADSIQSVMGFSWPQATSIGIASSTQHNLLVFAKGTQVHQAVMFERARGDFAVHNPAYCVPKRAAVFNVTNPEATTFRALAPIAVVQAPAPPPTISDAPTAEVGTSTGNVRRSAPSSGACFTTNDTRAPVTRCDTVAIMAAAGMYVKQVSGAAGYRVDPGADNLGIEVAKRMNVRTGTALEVTKCTDAGNTKSCRFQGVDMILRFTKPVLRDGDYWVPVNMTWPIKDEPSRTQSRTFNISVYKVGAEWVVHKGDPPPQINRD